MKEKIKEIFTELVESIEVNGYYRQVNRLNVSNNGKVDTIYIHFSDFKNHDDTLPEMDLGSKIHNKWYFRLYNKIIEEYTNSDEDYLAMSDNYSVINFYTDWISKLEYAPYGLFLRVNLSELISFMRDKKISKLLE